MRWRWRSFLPLLTATVMAATQAAEASPSTVPNNWVHHAKAPWSWWTPPHWVDAHGPYDLNISSPTGADWVKYGFSEAPASYTLTQQQNADAFFSYWMSNYRAGSLHSAGLYSTALARDSYTSVAATTANPPTLAGYGTDFRKTVTFAGTRRDGVRIRGEMVMDYTESVYGDIGIESFQVRAAPRDGYATTITTLRTIQHYITYTGSLT